MEQADDRHGNQGDRSYSRAAGTGQASGHRLIGRKRARMVRHHRLPSFALVISKLFFPSGDGVTALLLTFGTFALSYVIRPLGAMVLGSYGDKAGRKKALTVTILLMTLGTGIMAFAPTARTVGASAALIILISRLLQGFSAGPLPALLAEMFPTNIRSTGMSVSYNLGVTSFGGFAPLILTWLIARTGSLLAPSYYYIVVAFVSLIGLTVARTRQGHR